MPGTTWLGEGRRTLLGRLQPERIHVTTVGAPATPCAVPSQTANILDFTYDFDLGTANNGNLQQIVNNLDSSRTQSFSYDELNRIATVPRDAIKKVYLGCRTGWRAQSLLEIRDSVLPHAQFYRAVKSPTHFGLFFEEL